VRGIKRANGISQGFQEATSLIGSIATFLVAIYLFGGNNPNFKKLQKALRTKVGLEGIRYCVQIYFLDKLY